MNKTVEMPLWALILLVAFAAVTFASHFLFPSVRWFFRRRMERVVARLNEKLERPIQPFKLARRHDMIQRLIYDPEVSRAIAEHAHAEGVPENVAFEQAQRYAREIVPGFSASAYFGFAIRAARILSRALYRVRLGHFDEEALSQVDPDATVIFVMNHRSNMDYVLVSFLAAEKTTLSYAVGEWARIWPLQSLIRAMGAFFVRRNSGNELYRKVLERYVNMSTRAGVCQAVFLEGGLSKDGALREPRLGFLDYMLRDYHPRSDRDIVFIPVGINYDRVIEDRSLLRNLERKADRRSLWFVIKTSVSFIFKNALLSRKNRWRRFGYASVNFGEPVSARQYCEQHEIDFSALDRDQRFDKVGELATELMQHISNVVPVLPVSLISEVVLKNAETWRSELELKSQCIERIHELEQEGAPIDISSSALESVLGSALSILIGRGLVEEQDNLYRMKPDERDIIAYYANAIAHWK